MTWFLIGVVLLLAGCGGGGDGGSTPTAATSATAPALRDVTVLEDANCYHLGDESRPELCPGRHGGWFGTAEHRWTFTVTSQPTEGRLTLHVVDLGPIGADVRVNGQAVNMPLPLGDGSGTGSIPGSAFRLGTNELVIRSRQERPGLIEDFQLDQVRLVVTVPA